MVRTDSGAVISKPGDFSVLSSIKTRTSTVQQRHHIVEPLLDTFHGFNPYYRRRGLSILDFYLSSVRTDGRDRGRLPQLLLHETLPPIREHVCECVCLCLCMYMCAAAGRAREACSHRMASAHLERQVFG